MSLPRTFACLALAAAAAVVVPSPSAAQAVLAPPDALAAPTPGPAQLGGQQPIEIPSWVFDEDPLPRPLALRAPGTDASLCLSWEPTIAVDPSNPGIVAVAQGRRVTVSFDGGVDGFPVTLTAPATNPGGDASLAFDSAGRLFISYLCSPGAGRDVCMTGYSCDPSGPSCTILPGAWPVNVTAAAGSGGNNADKEWIAADPYPGSPFQDRIHVVWVRLDTGNPWSIWTTYSTDQGQTWSGAQQVSAADEGLTWPPHVAVAPNGSVYVAWHGQVGFLDPSGRDVPDGVSGQMIMRRSDDGGVTWQPRSFPYLPGMADMTYNVQHEANGVIPGATMWLTGSLQPWILPDPLVAGRVHVVANDDPDNNVDAGDAADVFIVTSSDSGTTWSAPTRVDQGAPGTFQVLPTAAINPVNGAIAVAWYDNRALADANLDGTFELDLMATFSTDGGATWSPEVDINDGRIDPNRANLCRFCGADNVTNQQCGTVACPGPATTRIGEYNGIAYGECTLYFAWADDAVCGGDYDTYFDRDPAMGGDATAPTLACPADAVVACGAPTDPAATGMATAVDDCDLDPVVTFTDAALPGDCPPGSAVSIIQRTWRAVDAAGNVDTCVQLVTTADMAPPALVVPPPMELECNGPGGVAATDPAIVAWLATASATDDCALASLVNDAPALFPAGCLPAGQATLVTFTATDGCGKVTALSSTVSVVDSTPPDLAASAAVTELWPPNHEMIDIGLEVATSDTCDEAAPSVAVSVTSDEHPSDELGAGGWIHCPDAVVTDDGRVLVRAERAGTGDGRVLHVTVTATDACGNASQAGFDVSIPANKGSKGAAVDSGQAHDATVCP